MGSQRPHLFVAGTEDASPWVPFGDKAYIRHLSFDVHNNSFSNVLWVEGGGMLGRHKHRGPVSGFVLEGSWRYLEYDWVATPGGYVHESPGVIHTLVCDDPAGMKTVFWLNRSLEFYDDNDNLTNLDLPGGGFFMPLFVTLAEGQVLDDALREVIRDRLRREYTPRHVPDRIIQVQQIPATLTGKKMEVPVRRILLGMAPEAAANVNAMANPAALDEFISYARTQQDYPVGEPPRKGSRS